MLLASSIAALPRIPGPWNYASLLMPHMHSNIAPFKELPPVLGCDDLHGQSVCVLGCDHARLPRAKPQTHVMTHHNATHSMKSTMLLVRWILLNVCYTKSALTTLCADHTLL